MCKVLEPRENLQLFGGPTAVRVRSALTVLWGEAATSGKVSPVEAIGTTGLEGLPVGTFVPALGSSRFVQLRSADGAC